MSAPLSKEQQRGLEHLFSGNARLREEALRHVPEQDRERVRELVKIQKEALRLLDLMMMDLRDSGAEMRKAPNIQFPRRVAVRALAATVDGIIFSLKQVAFAARGLTGVNLTHEELNFLRESDPSGGKVRLPGFRDNFKQTFKLFAKTFHADCGTDFGQDGFSALCDTFDLRHRITHPKSFMTFCVNDSEMKRAATAIDWLSQELQRVLHDSYQSAPKSERP
jgi:hypothetical protein